jgi:tetratricopeptide (TPR) repeat protein
MQIQDIQGHALSGCNGAALDAFEQASHELRCFVGDPLTSANRALEHAPAMTMAHALVAWLCLLGTEPAGVAAACAALSAAKQGPATEREAMHLHAIAQLVAGEWHAAGRTLEDLSIRWPLDTLALQAGHQIDFFTGHSRMLRDRIARALPAWQPGRPAHHAVLGMLAFGLEETGDYAQAERLGREAVALERQDGWGWHAVAHVLEMQQRRREGIQWLRGDMAAWSEGSFFAIHNSWHLALFHLGLGEVGEALALVDERILAGASPVVMNMIDASAMLWRLQLQGVDVGTRWQALAERWAPVAEAGNYAFNDLHAMMAFMGAGRDDEARRLSAAQARAVQGEGDNVGFLRDVGLDATQAIVDFAHGRYGEAAERLRRARRHAHRFGGSHAQRELIDLTLIEAAGRGGQHALAEALRYERVLRL